MSEYLPEVAWSTIASNVSLGPSSYRYYVTTNPLDPNEPGASTMTMVVGDWFIDYAGYPFLIEDILGSVITVYDILERGDGVTSAYGPYADKVGFVYRPKNGAFLLTQAQLRKLDASAIDIITPIEKGIIWKYRGIEIDALYGDGEAVETIAEDSIDNITKLSLSPEFILRTEEDGWQGGKKYSLSLDGLLHNNLQGVQGTGLDDDYIHLDQDQIDALWTKDGLNITRDSAASLTGILSVDEIKSYTSDIPLIKKEGNNVRISTCILSDCVNDRIGIFTETPLDHLHLTGYARISTLAEPANSSIVTSNADGRLIKLPYDNDEGKYLRSDGTWAPILTSTGDFLDSVIRMVADSTFDPGTPSNGDRYIILNAASIHANFGTINKFSDGSALTLGNNDIVQYFSANNEFRIVYDASAALQPATVTVGTDKNGNTNHQWTYNVTDDMWVDRGAAASHNSLDGLNDGNYKHLTAAQYTNFISLTDGSDISNTLHNHNTLYAIKQSSTTDTTSGRGLIVGAFGLGNTGTAPSIDDYKNYCPSGFYLNLNTATDSPYTYASTIVNRFSSTIQHYISFSIAGEGDNANIKASQLRNGVLSPWVTLYHSGNLTGDISSHNHDSRYAVKQSSTTDTTAGRGMITGAFGLGTIGVSTSLSDNSYSRLFWTNSDTPTANNHMGIKMLGITGYSFDIAARNDRFWLRTMEGGAQQSWREIHHTGNLVNPTTGIGTANYISKFTGTTTLGNSIIYETGGNILIGTITSRLARLQVVSSGITTERPTLGSGNCYTALFNWSSNTFGLGIYNNPSDGRAYIQNQRYDGNTATYDICLQPLGGAVAIGKTSVGSGYVLDTNGSVKVGGNIISTGGAGIGKTTVESGYILDTNGSVKVNGNIVATGNITARNKLYLGTTTPPVTDTGTLNALVWDNTTGEVKQRAITGGTGTANQIAYFTGTTSLGSLSTATYPSLTELSRVKGVTSAIQTQLNSKQATLVSGTNIKTIATNSILGSGSLINITISATEPSTSGKLNGDIWVES